MFVSLCPILLSCVHSFWNQKWQNISSYNFIKSYRSPIISPTHLLLKREYTVVLKSLQIGHSHGHTLSNQPSSFCPTYSILLTVSHIIFQYPYSSLRISLNLSITFHKIFSPASPFSTHSIPVRIWSVIANLIILLNCRIFGYRSSIWRVNLK